MRKLTTKILLAIVFCLPLLAFAPARAAYDPLCPTTDSTGTCTSGACQGEAANSPVCNQARGQGNSDPVAGNDGILIKADNIISLVAGIAALVMVFIGGLFYTTSAGNEDHMRSARTRIVSALIGLGIISLSWFIIRLVIQHLVHQ